MACSISLARIASYTLSHSAVRAAAQRVTKSHSALLSAVPSGTVSAQITPYTAASDPMSGATKRLPAERCAKKWTADSEEVTSAM
jgi:hypothetical protein